MSRSAHHTELGKGGERERVRERERERLRERKWCGGYLESEDGGERERTGWVYKIPAVYVYE